MADTAAVVLANAAGVTLNLAASETIGSLSGGGAAGGNVALNNRTLTTGDASSTSYGGVIGGTGGLVKQGAGTFTLTGTSTYTGATGVSGGTLALSGATGAATGGAFAVNSGARLLLDNSAANNNNRIAGALTLNGGEFVVLGNAAANTTETLGALTLATGYSTITLDPNAATNTRVTFASLARTAGATGLFRGTNLGANTVASQTAGTSSIVFTTAPALTGAGNAGTATVGIVTGAIGAGGASGSTSAGTDFVTYNPPTGTVNGLRPLLVTEYTATPAANVNLKLTANRTADDTFTINSLLLAGGVTYNYDATAGANTLTIASGNVFSTGGANSIQPTQTTGAIAFGATEVKVFTVSDLTFGSNAPITGTGVFSKSGSGVLIENRNVARTGGIIVNSGILRSGINSAFASQAMTVRAAGTLDLNGFNNTISTLTLESGANVRRERHHWHGHADSRWERNAQRERHRYHWRDGERQPRVGHDADCHGEQRYGRGRSHHRRSRQRRRRHYQVGRWHACALRREHLHRSNHHQRQRRHAEREHPRERRRREQHRRFDQRRDEPGARYERHVAIRRRHRVHQPQLHAHGGPDEHRECHERGNQPHDERRERRKHGCAHQARRRDTDAVRAERPHRRDDGRRGHAGGGREQCTRHRWRDG